MQGAEQAVNAGSSPRGRGKLLSVCESNPVEGLIPARAGKTLVVVEVAESHCGSSPRGRGKLIKSCRDLTYSLAHPRAGGENTQRAGSCPTPAGSSPRGRGKRSARRDRNHARGLIPARAGKTGIIQSLGLGIWAHPRAGGENLSGRWRRDREAGSSPRGRGKHFLTCAFIERIGQILETLELAVSSGSYSLCDVYATDAPQDQARNTGLALPSSRAAS